MARGLNFAVSLNVIPKQQILVEIENGIQKLPEHSANLIRNQVVSVLNNKRKLKNNLTNTKRRRSSIYRKIMKFLFAKLTKVIVL